MDFSSYARIFREIQKNQSEFWRFSKTVGSYYEKIESSTSWKNATKFEFSFWFVRLMSSSSLQKNRKKNKNRRILSDGSRFLCRSNGSIRPMKTPILSAAARPLSSYKFRGGFIGMIGNYSAFFSAHLGALMRAVRVTLMLSVWYCLVDTCRYWKYPKEYIRFRETKTFSMPQLLSCAELLRDLSS